MSRRLLRWLGALLAAAVLLAVLAVAGLRYAAAELRSQVEQALGPESSVDRIELQWRGGVVLHGLAIRAPRGWPARHTLRARRIVLASDLRAALGGTLRIRAIDVHDPYLSVLRTAHGVRLLPSLLERPAPPRGAAPAPMPPITIGAVRLHRAAIDFFDAAVRSPPLHLRLEQLDARVGPLDLPALASRTSLDLAGVLKGPQRNGSVRVAGWAILATRDSSVTAELQGADLLALEPYLLRPGERGIKRGAVDLKLQSDVQGGQIVAPGSIRLSHMALGANPLGTFAGLPRMALSSFLTTTGGKAWIRFRVEGQLGGTVSFDELLSRRIGGALGGAMGIGAEGVSKGFGAMGKGVRAAGSAVGRLFGGDPEPEDADAPADPGGEPPN